MTRIELLDGKYTVVNELEEGGGFRALRYGEEWRNLNGDNLVLAMAYEIEELREKQDKKEVTKTVPGGGKCPSCDVRLIGKANYCGKCGQRIGWKVYGGNIYDKGGDVK